MHHLLIYDLAPDYRERREAHRRAHLEHAWQAQRRGELVLAGALAQPADQAVLLFECDDPAVPERFAEADPYVQQGVVTGYRVRPWTTVVGEQAVTPVYP